MTKLIKKQGKTYIKDLYRTSYREKKLAFHEFLIENFEISLDNFIKKVFEGKNFNNTSIDKAEFIAELLNDEISLENWVFLRNKFQNIGYLTDRRHAEEYAYDIVLGWLSEELILIELEKQVKSNLKDSRKTSIGLMGIDADREFQKLNIRAKADIFIEIDETLLKIDLFVDYKGTWQKNGYFDLKKGKINHFSKNQLDWVLAFDVLNKIFYLISKDEALGYELTANPSMGNVKTAHVPLSNPFRLNKALEQIFQGAYN